MCNNNINIVLQIDVEYQTRDLHKVLSCADPEGGGGGPGVRTLLRFVRGEVLHGCLMGRRGGPKVVFIFLLQFLFWLASLASIIHIEYNNVWKLLILFKFKGSSSLQDRYTHDPWFSWKCISMFISSRITQFYSFQTKNFPQTPPPFHRVITNTSYMLKLLCQMCFCVGQIPGGPYLIWKSSFNHTNTE